MGDNCMQFLSSNDNNTCFGASCLFNNAVGTGNVGLGFSAGYYETGSNHLWVDNATRANLADAQSKALLYGTFDPTVANQQVTVNGTLKGTSQFILNGTISPTQITGNQNDYNPTGLSTASYVRINSDGTVRTITGLAGGADGRVIVLQNTGTTSIVLSHESASSSAANRFHFTSALDFSLIPDDKIVLHYDGTAARWYMTRPSVPIYKEQFPAWRVDIPTNADYTVNAIAPAVTDPTNNGLTVRQFDDTTEQGFVFMLEVPANSTGINFKFKGRAQTSPGASRNVGWKLYFRKIGDAATPSTWSSLVLSNLNLSDANRHYYTQFIKLTDPGTAIVAGSLYEFEITRPAPSSGTNLTGNFLLDHMIWESW
jgi:hypothetical protein